MDSVISTDRTPIAYWTSGEGPPLVAVHGATADHARWRPVLTLLERTATVHAIDRRGRGGSGDNRGHGLDREFEDVAAVVRAVADRTGGRVDLLGHSYGAIVSLGAARLAGDHLRRLVLYEPPVGPAGELLVPDLVERLESLVARGRREEAIETFFREEVGVPPEELAVMRGLPAWRARVTAAHTVPRELRAVTTFDPAPDWLRAVTVPTLLLLGGDSPAAMARGVEQVHRHLPVARIAIMPGQRHVAIDTAPELFASLVRDFLVGRHRPTRSPRPGRRPARR